MNKLIPVGVHDRVFMCVAGPSGSGKTHLIYSMLLNKTFHPEFNKIVYFYRHWQEIYADFLRNIKDIEFVACTSFDVIEGVTQNIKRDETGGGTLLIFDDICEEILQNQDFSNLATSGRHKRLSVIFIKHNLFQQGKYSVTIDKNSTHIVLMKSPRIGKQLKILASELGTGKFLEECYKKAVENNRFGHLLIDLTQGCPDGLRYCSDIVGNPTYFWLPSKHARVTKINDETVNKEYAERHT